MTISVSLRGVRGRWEGADPKYPDGISDNFKSFKDAMSSNSIEIQAVFETWTGKQAQKHLFVNAKIITNSNELVIVEFTK